MSRRHDRVTFKPYTVDQPSLLPPSLDELIPADHLVRVVHRIIEHLKLEPLLARYKGGGRSSYHPRMMLQVLVYAYTQRLYSSRQIAKALRENIHFMWLSGRQQPDFRTLNDFRGRVMKPVIDEVFGAVLTYLLEQGYVRFENYFLDGTKLEANANKHKVVWAKRNRKQQARVQEKIQALLAEIEQTNAAEQAEYGDHDLEETGGGKGGPLDAAKLEQTITELNRKLSATAPPAARQALRTLERDCLPRQQRYEAQARTRAGRNSYAQTDPDATCLRMKEDRGAERPWPKPAYNVQLGTENQFVVGFSLHARAGDTSCLIPHLQGVAQMVGRLPQRVIADAGYGSEENYAYLTAHQVEPYVKYNTFHQEHVKHRNPALIQAQRFRAEHWPYAAEQDEFTCPAQQALTFQGVKRVRSETGYVSERRVYACAACGSCAWKAACTHAKGNRRMQVSFPLQRFRAEAERLLVSAEGKILRGRRSVESEGVFGQIKHNGCFRRFHLRGQAGAKIEIGLLGIAHNLKKVAAA